MSKQRSAFSNQQKSNRIRIVSLVIYAVFFLFSVCGFQLSAFSAEKWPGVDESVVEKYAKEHGREAITPLINTDQGDLLLFVFLIAGTVGGFAAGYCWRILMVERSSDKSKRER